MKAVSHDEKVTGYHMVDVEVMANLAEIHSGRGELRRGRQRTQGERACRSKRVSDLVGKRRSQVVERLIAGHILEWKNCETDRLWGWWFSEPNSRYADCQPRNEGCGQASPKEPFSQYTPEPTGFLRSQRG